MAPRALIDHSSRPMKSRMNSDYYIKSYRHGRSRKAASPGLCLSEDLSCKASFSKSNEFIDVVMSLIFVCNTS